MPEHVKNEIKKLYQVIPDGAGTVVNKFQGLKSVAKLVTQPLNFVVDRLKDASKQIPEPLKMTNSAFSNITGFLCSLEIIHKIKELAHGTPWKGKSFADRCLYIPGWIFKTGKNFSVTFMWTGSFFATSSKAIATAVKVFSPIASCFDILGFSFTLAEQGVKLNRSFKKEKQLLDKKEIWKKRGEEWKKNDPKATFSEISGLASHKMYGKKDSLYGRMDKQVDSVTIKTLSRSFLRHVREGRLSAYGFSENMTVDGVIRKVKGQMRQYLFSDQMKPSAILQEVLKENKKIASLVVRNDKLHLKWRKWEALKLYVESKDQSVSADQRVNKLLDYAKLKVQDKSKEIKDEKLQQRRTWYDVAFAVFVISIATISLIVFFSPIAGAAIPWILAFLMFSTNVLSFRKFLDEEKIINATKERIPVPVPVI